MEQTKLVNLVCQTDENDLITHNVRISFKHHINKCVNLVSSEGFLQFHLLSIHDVDYS